MSLIPHITGLAEIADKYDAFFLDIYGLLHNGMRINPGTLDCLEMLRNDGKKVCLVSNTPKMPEDVIRDLRRYHIERSLYDEMVTAGASAHLELEEKHQGQKVLFFGTPEFAGPLRGLNILETKNLNDADFILNSIPGSVRFNQMETTTLLREAQTLDLKMICANPDMVVHIGNDLVVCAGTYAAMYEEMGGKVSYHGKPYSKIYELARELLGNPDKSSICAIGDALHTDIRGATNYGIDSIWALSGIHWEELRYDHKPEHPDPKRIEEALTKSPHKPVATMTDFRW